MSTMEAGKVFYKEGYVQTGRAYFKLVVQGKRWSWFITSHG